MMGPKPDALVVVRLSEAESRVEGDDDTRRCGTCLQLVCVFPSGLRVLAEFPNTELICNRCYKSAPGDVGWLAPGALEELQEHFRRKRRH